MKRTKKLLALWMALIMMLGSLAALAEGELPEAGEQAASEEAANVAPELNVEPAPLAPPEQVTGEEAALGSVGSTITVEGKNSEGKVDITVTTPGVVEQDRKHTAEDFYLGEIDGVKVEVVKPEVSYPPVKVEIDGAGNLNEALKGAFEAGGGITDNGETNLDSVTVNVGEDGKSNITETVTGSDSGGTVNGTFVERTDHSAPVDVTVNAGDVTLEAKDTGEDKTVNVNGVYTLDQAGQGDTTINVGNIIAATDKGSANGIFSQSSMGSSKTTIQTGQLNVSGSDVTTGVYLQATGKDAVNIITVGTAQAEGGEGAPATEQEQSTDAPSAGASAVTDDNGAQPDATRPDPKDYAIYAVGTGDGTYGVYSWTKNGGKNETTVNGKIYAEGNGFTAGVDSSASDGGQDKTTVNGDIDVVGTSSNRVTAGIYAQGTGSSTIIANGKISVNNTNGGATGVRMNNGSAAATGAISANAKIRAVGIENGSSTVAANGDVSAEGEQYGYGAWMDGTADVLVDGTLSGSTAAVYGPNKPSLDDATLTVWAAQENAKEEIAKVDGDDENRTAATAFEKKINYIIRVADAWKEKLTNDAISTEKKNTVSVDWKNTAAITHGTTEDGKEYDYHTAVEGEEVTIDASKLNLDEDEGLDGVYYYCDEDETKNSALITENKGGIFTLKMGEIVDGIRGMMQLGLKTHVHDYSVTRTKEPTCTDTGTDLYQCKYCTYKYEKTVDALGHKYNEVVTPPTCTDKGFTTHTCQREGCGDTYTDNPTDPIGHKWGEPTYTWSADNKTVTAKRVCQNDPSHVEEETANVSSAVAVKPTCLNKGITTYTATFKNAAFAAQSKTLEDIPALGHDYKAVVTPPTCTEKGFTTYTCQREGCGDTYTDNPTDPIGHKWGEPTYTWSADNKTVTAKRVCKNDPSHVEEETVNVTSEVTKQPTTEAKGETTYTATFKNPAFKPQSKKADIDKLPSDPQNPQNPQNPQDPQDPQNPQDPEDQTGKKNNTGKKLVYSKVNELRGLNPADRTEMGDALKTIAQSIEAEAKTKGGLRGRRDAHLTGGAGVQGLGVRMWYLDEGVLVPADLLARYDALSLQDRLFILMDLLGCGTPDGLTEEGQAVLDDIHAAIDAMTPEQQAARQADMDRHFQPRLVIDENGVEHASVGIELEIAEGEHLSYERYTFFEDEGEWKLFEVEQGEYK